MLLTKFSSEANKKKERGVLFYWHHGQRMWRCTEDAGEDEGEVGRAEENVCQSTGGQDVDWWWTCRASRPKR